MDIRIYLNIRLKLDYTLSSGVSNHGNHAIFWLNLIEGGEKTSGSSALSTFWGWLEGVGVRGWKEEEGSKMKNEGTTKERETERAAWQEIWVTPNGEQKEKKKECQNREKVRKTMKK